MDVIANATSSTTIIVQWGSVLPEDRNGQIDGYKVSFTKNSLHKFSPVIN